MAKRRVTKSNPVKEARRVMRRWEKLVHKRERMADELNDFVTGKPAANRQRRTKPVRRTRTKAR